MTSDIEVTAAEAAAEVGVQVGTVYSWVRRGYLAPVRRRGRYKMFHLADVFRAERECRQRAQRTRCYAGVQDQTSC